MQDKEVGKKETVGTWGRWGYLSGLDVVVATAPCGLCCPTRNSL